MITDIYDLLYQLGIKATYKGFFHTSYAVLLSVENKQRLLFVTKWLYPEVAKHYNTTPECVERNIRTIATIAWQSNPALLQTLARYQISRKPSTSELVAILAATFDHAGNAA